MRKCNRVKVWLLVTEMEVKLQFSVFMLLIQASLAVWQRVTVMKGQVLTLTCPITDAHKSHVEWRNSEGLHMFFNNHKAIKDKRYSIIKLSETEFSVSISNVTFKDGGIYRCLHYTHPTTEKKVEVTVIGRPTSSATLHDGKIVTKCTAEANYPPPSISWQFDQGPEFDAHVQVHHEGKKYISVGMINVVQPKEGFSLKCLVRHPALHSQHLLDFTEIGKDCEYISVNL
uniref:Cytotoxic and regulatory T cell molecule n=1 Tax=Stegastes partitus TaxID=144197 RepID=A0A3B4Z0X1_9TELE